MSNGRLTTTIPPGIDFRGFSSERQGIVAKSSVGVKKSRNEKLRPLVATVEENARDNWNMLIAQHDAAVQRREYALPTVRGVVIAVSRLLSLSFAAALA
jgi:hypothetical protein